MGSLMSARIARDTYAVISNFNFDPRPLARWFESFEIRDQSEAAWDGILSEQGLRVQKSLHVGHNLLDYLDYFIDNWDNLPDKVLLAKGNMLTRHCSPDDLQLILEKGVFAPVFSQSWVTSNKFAFVDTNGWFQETNNSWYAHLRPHRYFTSLDEMGSFLFSNWSNPPYVGFSPGALYLVERARIKNVGRATFTVLRELLRYAYFPSEAWMIERLLGSVLSNHLVLRKELMDESQMIDALRLLPDKSNLYLAPPGPLAGAKRLLFGARRINLFTPK